MPKPVQELETLSFKAPRGLAEAVRGQAEAQGKPVSTWLRQVVEGALRADGLGGLEAPSDASYNDGLREALHRIKLAIADAVRPLWKKP